MSRRCATVFLLMLLAAAPLLAQATHPISGRRIAPIMGHQGASWLDRPEREKEEAPAKAIAALGIKPGQTVADIGAGSGYYTVRLAEAVGENGRVFASDIQPEMLALVERKVKARSLANVSLVLGAEEYTRLPDGAIDLALMVDVYHELARPQAFLRSVRRALRNSGRLVLIEFRKEDPAVPVREEHKMSVREARLELEAEGFKLDRVIDVLPWQHIFVFTLR